MSENILNVPKGYKWCESCEALTPHDGKRSPECVVCGTNKFGYEECPHCGWEHDPERDLNREVESVKAHKTDCEYWDKTENGFRQKEIEYILTEGDCDCPEVDIYPSPLIFNYRMWHLPGFNCPNEIAWAYDVRCPICGTFFDIEDSNC